MKKLFYALVLFTIAFVSCKKDNDSDLAANGTFTARLNIYDSTTKKWFDENFTATSTITTKSGNDYTIVAKDANGTVITAVFKGATGVGKISSGVSTVLRNGTTHTGLSFSGQVTTLTDNSLEGNYQSDGAGLYIDAKVSAKF